MKTPYTLGISYFCALTLGVLFAFTSASVGQPPSPEDSPSSAKQDRPKPQVIYHLSNASSETAVALHAQSKAADTSLFISPDMPLSLQLARANANADAAAAANALTVSETSSKVKNARGNKSQKVSARRGAGGSRGRASKRGDAGSGPQDKGHPQGHGR